MTETPREWPQKITASRVDFGDGDEVLQWTTTPVERVSQIADAQVFLRADTCTPNEECVSKAELEGLIGRWLDGLELCSDTPLVEVHRKERAALIKELREVMK